MRNLLLTLAALTVCSAVHGQTFTVTPASGPGPFTVAWDVPGGTACAAAGIADWTGAKAATGTVQVSPGTGAKSLTLACTVPGPPEKASVTLAWEAATMNVDNTPYTNPKGYVVYGEKKATPTVILATVTPPSTLRYKAEDLNAGKWFFGIKSLNAADVASDMSPIISWDAVDTPTTVAWSKSASIIVTAPLKPKAPVLSIAPASP